MLVAAALVPSPPLLVPELAGAAAEETDDLRRAVLDVGERLGSLASRWIAVGIGDSTATVPETAVGTYAGFGADVIVSLSPGGSGPVDRNLALAALTAGWVRTSAAPYASVEVRTVPADLDPAGCRDYGSDLRSELDASPDPIGLLLIADGATTLTAKAPGSFVAAAPDVQADVDTWLAQGDLDSLTTLDVSLCREIGMAGRAVWQIGASVFGAAPRATALYSGAPYGVGYFVGLWQP